MICEDHEEYQESEEDGNSQGFDSEFEQVDLTKVASHIEKLKVDDYQEELHNVTEVDFNILELSRKMPREKILPVMATKFMNDLELTNIVDQGKLANFLVKLQSLYLPKITYHNDLHGADVMQFAYYMMVNCNLIEIFHLDKLDCMSLIIAAAAHDLGHDGFNNNYHVNAIT